jgi:hypothetical protein
LDKAILMGEGQRLKEDGVDDAEDGGIGADAEGQRENGYNRKTATAIQLPQRITNILTQFSHAGFLLWTNYRWGDCMLRAKGGCG